MSNEENMYYIFRMYGGNRFAYQPTQRALSQFDKSDAFSFIKRQKVSDSFLEYRENNDGIINQERGGW